MCCMHTQCINCTPFDDILCFMAYFQMNVVRTLNKYGKNGDDDFVSKRLPVDIPVCCCTFWNTKQLTSSLESNN